MAPQGAIRMNTEASPLCVNHEQQRFDSGEKGHCTIAGLANVEHLFLRRPFEWQ